MHTPRIDRSSHRRSRFIGPLRKYTILLLCFFLQLHFHRSEPTGHYEVRLPFKMTVLKQKDQQGNALG